ncbi:hypothetical protein DFH09DRAFT_1140294 [Mycena vulgaris]|nr:hypothetical protein DFH09DRAFT_1140294 [Mycena vulgaris]
MFSCRRVGQRAAWQRLGWRAESTSSSSAATASSTLSPSVATVSSTISPSTRVRGEHPHLAHVLGHRAIVLRAAEDIVSPVDAFAIIRAVERRFGRVAEYRFHRDADCSARYQYIAYMAFWDPAAYARVPQGNVVLNVILPPVNQNTSELPGGIGLADITPVLDAQDWTDNNLADEVDGYFEQPTDGSRVIPVRVEHYAGRFQKHKMLPPLSTMRSNHSLVSQFVHWGGFAPMTPAPKAHITRSDLLFGGAPVDHPHMRHLLQGWQASSQNPYESRRRSPAPTWKPEPPTSESKNPFLQAVTETDPQTEEPIASSRDTPTSASPTLSAQLPAAEPTAEASPTPPLQAKAKQAPPPPKAEPKQATVKATEPTPDESPKPTAPPRAAPIPMSVPISDARAARNVMRNAPFASQAKIQQANAKPRVGAKANANAASKSSATAKPNAAKSNATATAKPTKKQKGAEKGKDAKGGKEKATSSLPSRPVEVEERQTGMATRLKGLLGGWL